MQSVVVNQASYPSCQLLVFRCVDDDEPVSPLSGIDARQIESFSDPGLVIQYKISELEHHSKNAVITKNKAWCHYLSFEIGI